jgi:hypothetical protein
MFSATSDDRGQEHRQHGPRECQGLELGQADPRCGRDGRGVDVAADQRQDVSGDDGQEDRKPTDDAAEERERRYQEH